MITATKVVVPQGVKDPKMFTITEDVEMDAAAGGKVVIRKQLPGNFSKEMIEKRMANRTATYEAENQRDQDILDAINLAE